MKTKNLMMVVVSAICLSNTIQASTFTFPFRTKAISNYKMALLHPEDYSNALALSEESNPEDWKLCYEADNISIYERWIKKLGGKIVRERKGVMFANCDIAYAVRSISDYEIQKKWMKNVKENRLLKRKSDTCWTTYTLFGLPWPLDNRDVVSEYHLKEARSGAYAQININSIKNLVKESEGVSRINNYNATWFVKKINDKRVAINFTASSDAVQIAPAFVLDPLMRKTFQKTLLNLRNHLEMQLLVNL